MIAEFNIIHPFCKDSWAIFFKIYKTAPGNHARKNNFDNKKVWFNIRQIEVIRGRNYFAIELSENIKKESAGL